MGLSTAAWIEPDPDRRLALVLGWDPRPEFVSVNLHEPVSTELVRAAASAGIGVEAGVWNAMSARRLIDEALAGYCLRVLVEPPEADPAAALATLASVDAVLDAAEAARPWTRPDSRCSAGSGIIGATHMADSGQLDDRYKIAYDSSASLIAGQRSIVDNLRQRATVLVTAVTISVSLSVSVGLLGTGAKPLPGWALAFLLALVVLVGGCSFYILLPRAWIFGHSGSAIIQEHIEDDDPSSINDMYRDMTIYLDRYFDDNERQLGRLFKAFQVGVLGLAAEVVVLIVGFLTR